MRVALGCGLSEPQWQRQTWARSACQRGAPVFKNQSVPAKMNRLPQTTRRENGKRGTGIGIIYQPFTVGVPVEPTARVGHPCSGGTHGGWPAAGGLLDRRRRPTNAEGRSELRSVPGLKVALEHDRGLQSCCNLSCQHALEHLSLVSSVASVHDLKGHKAQAPKPANSLVVTFDTR